MRVAGRGASALIAGLLFSFSGAAQAAPSGFTKQPLGGLLGATLAAQIRPASRLSLLFGEHVQSPECATPLLLALRAGSSLPRESLLEPPPLAEQQTWLTPDGRVALHYTLSRASADFVPSTDRNRNGIPDYVEAAGLGLSESLQAADEVGYLVRFSPSHRLEVYLANLGGTVRGYMAPLARPGRGASFIVIDTQIYGDEPLLKAVAAHQAAHALLAEYDLDEPIWWHEASAASLELLSQRSLLRYVDSVDQLLSSPEQGLLQPDGAGATPAGLLWASYLIESSGGRPDVLRQIWEEEATAEGDNLLEATDRVLRLQGRSLQSTFADFTTWNLFTGPRDDQQHYSFGLFLQEPHFAASHGSYPAAAISFTQAVAPLGWSLIRLQPDGNTGGIFLTFEGDVSGEWQADLLIATRRNPQSFRRLQLPLDGQGRASLGVPWGNAAEVMLLVRNVHTAGPPSTYSYAAQPAPAYPYELGSLSAEPEGEHVRVFWESESEEGLSGWDVYRSEGRGEFQKISEVSIPAFGGSDGPVAYQFLDTAVRPGALYQYYVVGITNEGLTQRSFVVTTRIPR